MDQYMESPESAGRRLGAGNSANAGNAGKPENSTARAPRKAAWLTVGGGGDGSFHARVVGRELWTVQHLLRAGPRGVSSLEHIGPRLSHYIFKLRGYGLAIETVREAHAGAFAGVHARYMLRCDVTIEEAE